MRITEKELYLKYLQSRLDYYQNDVIKLRQRIRFRDVDVNDCFELALAIERLSAFQEFYRDTMALFGLSAFSEKGD